MKPLSDFAQEFTLHTGIKVTPHKVYTDVMLELDTYQINVERMKAISEYLGTVFHVEGQFNGINKAVSMQPLPNSNRYCMAIRITNNELTRVFGEG